MPDLVWPDHRGRATWGERLVPLEEFARAAAVRGCSLSHRERLQAAERLLARAPDSTPIEGPFERVAVFGGVYSNAHALAALIEDAAKRGAERLYCLGDLGGFGPHPERIRALLDQAGAFCIQGNYEQALSGGLLDCNCGYTDPRDNHFAALSYEYTAKNCSVEFKAWMGGLPLRRRVKLGERELLLVHGSPRRINEFLFRSNASLSFLERLIQQNGCDALLCTHSGLPWHRRLPSGADVLNVGVIGRPANDGRTEVVYAMVEAQDQGLGVEIVPLRYDHERLAREMRAERLPEEFVLTVLSGWWTTCLEILPARERARSRF